MKVLWAPWRMEYIVSEQIGEGFNVFSRSNFILEVINELS